MTPTLARPTLVLAATASLLLAACGGAATPSAAPSQNPATAAPTAAPTPSPTPATTPSPTPTAAPTPSPVPSAAAVDGFAFPPGDVLDYYVSLGFECEDPYPSDQAAGHTVQRCLRFPEDAPIEVIALVIDDATGLTADAFAGMINPAGEEAPDREVAAEFLGGFLGAMLGADAVLDAATWMSGELGGTADTRFNGLIVATYPSDDETGVGYYVEVASDAFMEAPAP